MTVKSTSNLCTLELNANLAASYPYAIFAWIAAVNAAGTNQIAASYGIAASDYYDGLFIVDDNATKSAQSRHPGESNAATQTGAPNGSPSVMQPFLGLFFDQSHRGVAFGTTTITQNTYSIAGSDVVNFDKTVLFGRNFNGGPSFPALTGEIAEWAIFNISTWGTLSGGTFTLNSTGIAAVAALMAAAKPETVAGVIQSAPLLNSTSLATFDGSKTFTVVGSGFTNGSNAHPVSRVAAVPVSFSGPVPTRNGVLGTATTFANAGFFAGNLTPFTYSSVGTALPAGVTLNTSTGVLSLAASGATAGTTSGIIIRATDTGSNVANTNAYSIVIAASNAAPTFPGNISNLSGTAGTAITPVNVSGQFSDTDTLTYSASPSGTAWPSGLVVNSSTGIISGTVAGPGTTTGLKVRATDTASQTVDSNAFNAVIAAGSATRTWTPTIKLEALADETPFANWAVHAVINDMAGNKIDTKTGLTTSSAGLPPPFTTTTGSLATDYRVTYIDDVDLTIFAVENLRCV